MKINSTMKFLASAAFLMAFVPTLGCSESKEAQIPETFAPPPPSDTPAGEKAAKPESSQSD
ncbi:MAG: hypothetical protein MUD03_08760 [Pirellula sp.]|jgi:hypothetical protein|nr:hypothetical protein [Pirellula sp.]